MNDHEYKLTLQRQLCERLEAPMFIEEDGKCPYCKKDVMIKITETQCSEEIITYCPHCKRSFTE